jgi:hypothetical protein
MAFQTIGSTIIWRYTPTVPGKDIFINLSTVQYIEATQDQKNVWVYFAATGVASTQGPYQLSGIAATQFLTDLNAIPPGGSSPSEGTTNPYFLSDTDDASSPAYYGYLANDGSWYIKSYDGSGMRYTQGVSDYKDSWDVRTTLQYQYYNDVF